MMRPDVWLWYCVIIIVLEEGSFLLAPPLWKHYGFNKICGWGLQEWQWQILSTGVWIIVATLQWGIIMHYDKHENENSLEVPCFLHSPPKIPCTHT